VRLARSRLYLAAFWALAAAAHVAAFGPNSDPRSEAYFFLLSLLAALSAALAVELRKGALLPGFALRPAGRLMSRTELQSHLKSEIKRSRRTREPVAVMLVAVCLLAGPFSIGRERLLAATRLVAELLARRLEPGWQMFRLDRGTIAIVLADGEALARLQTLSTQLKKDALAERHRGASQVAFELRFGIAVNEKKSSSARTLLSNANRAVDRAENLRAERFVVVDDVIA
jgi:GGDEF domain-containing protein